MRRGSINLSSCFMVLPMGRVMLLLKEVLFRLKEVLFRLKEVLLLLKEVLFLLKEVLLLLKEVRVLLIHPNSSPLKNGRLLRNGRLQKEPPKNGRRLKRQPLTKPSNPTQTQPSSKPIPRIRATTSSNRRPPSPTNAQATDLFNTEQCIHTYNVVNTVEEIHTPEDILLNQCHLMSVAGEITEYEESYLQQLVLQKDPSGKEALRR